MSLTAPLDALHTQCVAARDAIRAQTFLIRSQIHAWQPAPCPPPTHPTRNGDTK